MAGGAGIYISSSLNAIPRSNLNFDSDDQVEFCWIEISREHNPSIIVWCIYRHRSSNHGGFMSQLENYIRSLNQSKRQVFTLVDMKIDFLKEGPPLKIEDYLDILWYSSNLLPVITKPPRITSHTATLIDLIYMHKRIYRTNHIWYCNHGEISPPTHLLFIRSQIKV